MRKISCYIIAILLLLHVSTLSVANNSIDSLLTLVSSTSDDNLKAELYYKLGNAYSTVNDKAQLIVYLKAEKIFSRLPNNSHKILNEIELAKYYANQGDLSKSEKFYLKAIENAEKIKNLELEFRATSFYMNDFTNINSPVKFLERIFELKEKAGISGDKKLLFDSYNLMNQQYLLIGARLDIRRQTSDSMLIIAEEMQDTFMLQTAYYNLGGVSKKTKDRIEYYLKSLDYTNRELDKSFLSRLFNNMSGIYSAMDEFSNALNYADTAYLISKEIGRKEGMAAAKMRKAEAYYYSGELKKAIENSKEALRIFQEAGILRRQSSCAEIIYTSYKELGNLDQALFYHEMFTELKDKREEQAQVNEAEFVDRKFSYDLSIKKDSIALTQERSFNKLKIENINAQLSKKRLQMYALYGGCAVVVLFSILIWIGFQRKRKANIIIEEQKKDVERQKEEIEQQHLEMTESIIYAKRIQAAILPPNKLVKEYLKESFILYKPKDIVAGDFYWMEHKGGKVLFAAADCTGHGVPGAMVSVICNNALNRSVREYGLTDPGKILDKTREIVIQEFEKSDEDVKDGMDIALCSLKGNNLQYAGAHNSLWIIRNGELIETKANKQPIGQFDNPEPYTTHSFELEKGDSIYIFSDGYVDQFGGEKGKKYKSANFKELLLSIQLKTMEEQKNLIDQTFERWKGSLEQIDDVCVIGVNI